MVTEEAEGTNDIGGSGVIESIGAARRAGSVAGTEAIKATGDVETAYKPRKPRKPRETKPDINAVPGEHTLSSNL